MSQLFLNIDAGELADEPDELYALADVVNIACGGQAGEDSSMRRVLAFCKHSATRAGAHPSFPDRENFGRTPMTLPSEALSASVAEQCHSLASIARVLEVPIGFAKLHGALYHAANADEGVARAALRGVIEALGWEFTLIGPATGRTIAVARELGLAYAREGFADRAMRADGSLVPRDEPGAMIDDPVRASAQASALRSSCDTICVHGDGRNSLEIARAVRAALA